MLPTLCVPVEIERKPIISEDRRAFSDLGDMEYISDSAFYQCSGLQRIVIGNPQCYMGYSFVGCENLTEILVNGVNAVKETARYGGTLYVLIQ
jgi:hypothetical protein